MKYSKIELQKALSLPQFPLSAKYDIQWVNDNEMGPNSMWLAEFLLDEMKLTKGMKVLDLGCGKSLSSIFLAKEFGVQVWAVDLWITATENYKRIKDAGVDDLVYPIHADAHSLPFANNFFDAIISLDAYHYFGTNQMYLESLIQYLKPKGQIGIVVPSVHEEFNNKVPEKLKPYWEPYLFTHHSPNWWKELWEGSERVKVQIADTMVNGYENWLKWDETLKEAGILKRNGDVEMLKVDGGNFTFARIIGEKI